MERSVSDGEQDEQKGHIAERFDTYPCIEFLPPRDCLLLLGDSLALAGPASQSFVPYWASALADTFRWHCENMIVPV
jgi:hypothetical protein